ncbi:MAG: T9SS type A sorting domain-containing protein [Bacteroidia bacterium]
MQIVPFSDGQNKYYLFYKNVTGGLDGIFYAIIDMNTVWGTPGLGEVVIKGQQINTNRIADCMQAVKHGNGRDWWLVTKMSDANLTHTDRFIEYLITPSGISGPFHFDFGIAFDQDFQKIIFNTSCSKIMNINTVGYMCEFDFDRCSGVISNPHVIYPEITTFPYNRIFWEGAYSPDDSVFYATTNTVSGVNYSYLLQYDLTAFDIPASCDTLDSAIVPIGTGAVRLAPDGKIYFSRAYKSLTANSYPYADTMYNYINMNLGVINEPNSLGATCNFQPFSFYLGGKRTYLGLPNNPDYDLGALAGSVCDTITGIAPSPLERVGVRFYPNPASENVLFEYDSIFGENSSLVIYNNMGMMVKTIQLGKNDSKTAFSVAGFSPGVYTGHLLINKTFKQTSKLTVIR